MQVTEILNEGLKRELKIVLGADKLDGMLDKKLGELKKTVQIRGFRTGKVPVSHLKRLYGQKVMAEVIEESVGDSTQKVLEERNEKPAYQPEIAFADEVLMPSVLAGNADLEFSMAFEVIPVIGVINFLNMKFEKLVAEVSDADVDKAVKSIGEQNKQFVPRKEEDRAEIGDQVSLDFEGSVDGEVFDGGSAENASLKIGSNQFIPGFEEQLVGTKAGDEKTLKVTFPQDYPREPLAGKDAEFKVKVHMVSAEADSAIDDGLAQRLGMEDLDALKQAARKQLQEDFASASDSRLKRTVLDKLDDTVDFALPEKTVQEEFDSIWNQLMHDIEHHGRTLEDEGTSEEEAKKEYRVIAERRVKLGLVLGKIGELNAIEVSDKEVQSALVERIKQYPGREQEMLNIYRNRPEFLAEVRGQVFEQKVIDYIAAEAGITEKTVSREELFADPDDEVEAEETKNKKEPPAKKASPAKKATSAKKASSAKKKPAKKDKG